MTRYRWRFSLRALLVVTTLVCIGLGWRWMQERNRRLLIRDIEHVGGRVTIAKPSWIPSFRGERVTSVAIPYRIKDEFGPERLNLFPRFNVRRIPDCEMPDGAPAHTGTHMVGRGPSGQREIMYIADGLTNPPDTW